MDDCECCQRRDANGAGVVPAANVNGSLRWAICPCQCHEDIPEGVTYDHNGNALNFSEREV